MKIEGNQKELDAMVEFHKGNRVEGLRLQEEFAAEFRKEYKDKDHCPCLKACRYHGNCKECVAIHRAHQEHVPNCMRPLINKKLKLMSELTEHTLANEIEAPHEILRKQASQIPVYWEVAENEKSEVYGGIKMDCLRCKEEMIKAKLKGDAVGTVVYLTNKKNGIFENEKNSTVSCYVCPKCGYVELNADNAKNLI